VQDQCHTRMREGKDILSSIQVAFDFPRELIPADSVIPVKSGGV
jgi:hypothetical protein